jgi:hypothetical protein
MYKSDGITFFLLKSNVFDEYIYNITIINIVNHIKVLLLPSLWNS